MTIDVKVRCPKCKMVHIDQPWGTWTNPPHKTHQCQNWGCDNLWRPYPFETNGVAQVTLAERLILWLRQRAVYEHHLKGYMLRWWLWWAKDSSKIRIRLHKILRSDLTRHLHDHPWNYLTIILKGGYYELTPKGRKWYGAGRILFRRAESRHALVLGNGTATFTLFITFPKKREWGFHTEKGWVHWRDYKDEDEDVNAILINDIMEEQKERT